MAQPQNNITTLGLLISDSNGGQPQMIKVMGGGKIPIQFAASSGSSPGSTTIKTFIKSSAVGDQNATLIQSNKMTNRQIIAVPAKQGTNIQGIRPVVLPTSNIQLKSTRNHLEQPYSTTIVTSRATPTVISSPMVIRTQTGSLAVASSTDTAQLSTHVHIPQINVNKQLQHTGTTSLLQTQLKQGSVTTNRQQTFTLKTQQHNPNLKQPEIILLQQKPLQDQYDQHQQKQKLLQDQPLQKTQQSSQPHGISPPKSLMNTSILDHSGSRKRHDFDFDYSVENKRRKTEKGGKGLRHFSMKVCEKVQAKGTTSYNEVADELVNEFSDNSRSNSPSEGVNYDQKNIRRRVYDALNVLMAMNIISKEKKEIHWLGLPTNSVQECHKLEQERTKRIQKIKLKTQQLQDLILQQIAFKNLVERNKKLEKDCGVPSSNSAIQLPFIIVSTSKKTVIDCSISNDKTEYLFNFDDTFEIHDDIEVLKRMGMALGLDKGLCTHEDLERAKSLVPKALEGYVTELADGRSSGSLLEPKVILQEDVRNADVDEDIDAAMNSLNSLCQGDFTFEKMGSGNASLRQVDTKLGLISRHSSLMSLSQDQRTESASPSSFGEEYDDDGLEDSDVDI